MTMKPEWQAWIEDWQSDNLDIRMGCFRETDFVRALASLIEHLQTHQYVTGTAILPDVADGEEGEDE